MARVKTIVDAALANAKVVGDQPVGTTTADISRAYDGVDSTGQGAGSSDVRGDESALGDLVANALRDGIPAYMASRLRHRQPGWPSRRPHLLGATTATNPANTDGVITYAEANNVLPFVNNTLGGGVDGCPDQGDARAAVAADGFAAPVPVLGLSDNVQGHPRHRRKPVGERVTSVKINGAPIDLAKTYSVSTFSFLAAGGDNFTAFTDGKTEDTGLVDRDLWIKLPHRPQAGRA